MSRRGAPIADFNLSDYLGAHSRMPPI